MGAPQGLTNSQAIARLAKYGKNELRDKSRRSAHAIFIDQLKNWFIILLLFACGVSFFLGARIDAIVILVIILVSTVFSFFQEFKAESAVARLKSYLTATCRALRSGAWQEIPTSLLVPGDVVSLRIGDRVPADIRLLDADTLYVDESILTGESRAVNKEARDPVNILYEGTHVVSGVGTGTVIATGNATRLGKTASMLEEPQPEKDFQKNMKKFSRLLSQTTLGMTILVFGANALVGKAVFDSLLFAVALAVGIAPELLPMIMTMTLSLGALHMARKNVIVKRLMSVEDFGNIDILCTDKTGTLTEGVFTLMSYESLCGNKNNEVLAKALLCSSGFMHGGKTSNEVDKALWHHRDRAQAVRLLDSYELTDENEFDFTRRMMSVVARANNRHTLIVKGAPESVLPICTMSAKIRAAIGNRINELTAAGRRVLVVAEKSIDKEETSIHDETRLTPVGILVFTDPVKKSAATSLGRFQKLGVAIKTVSGDSPDVVRRVAIEIGLIQRDSDARVVTGDVLDRLDEKAFLETVYRENLFARVTPEQKRRIVTCLNNEGHIVGFLGDGVNDAPALKAADVGIAVSTGADVAKEAADIVLLKKDLAVLADGIEQGRKTFGNITKYILNTISANWGNMITVGVSSVFLKFIPLLPKQILLTNVISDVPLVALATDRVDHSFTKKPKRWDISLITRFMLQFGFVSSLFDFAMIVPLLLLWKAPPELFRTAWFVESTLSEIIVTFAIRTQLPFYQSRPSRWLLWLSALSATAAMALPFLPMGGTLFSFAAIPLPIAAWIGCVTAGYFLVIEISKRRFFRRFAL